jgi:hypothetical protein
MIFKLLFFAEICFDSFTKSLLLLVLISSRVADKTVEMIAFSSTGSGFVFSFI